MRQVDIVIRYGRDGDHEEIALSYARRLFAVYGEAIDSLVLEPADVDLIVMVNGSVVYAEQDTHRAPRLADVMDTI